MMEISWVGLTCPEGHARGGARASGSSCPPVPGSEPPFSLSSLVCSELHNDPQSLRDGVPQASALGLLPPHLPSLAFYLTSPPNPSVGFLCLRVSVLSLRGSLFCFCFLNILFGFMGAM